MSHQYQEESDAESITSYTGFRGFAPTNVATSSTMTNELRQVTHMMLQLMQNLRGLAKTWYRALPSLNHDWHTWKQMLKTAFPSSLDYYQQLKVMTQRVKLPSESYMKYYYDQLALLTSLDITGEKAVSCIIGGISDMVVQTATRAGNYSTPDVLFKPAAMHSPGRE
ncbi:hypothetical protein CBL_20805 [Carabus blaptoides fortunei]